MIADYPGSKGGSGVWQRIICEMPPHETYIEAFLGSGVVLRKKLPARDTTIGIDASAAVVRAWSVAKADRMTPETAAAAAAVIHGDALALLPKLVPDARAPVLVYADPPYLMETRSCQRDYYEHEFTREDHLRLLAVLKALPCMVILSGYWSNLYAVELSHWRTEQIPTTNRRGKRVIEWLWCNFRVPTELHDPRFVGKDRRERWRITAKLRRWKRRLSQMPPLERQKIAELALQGLTPEASSRDPANGNGVAVLDAGNGVAAGGGVTNEGDRGKSRESRLILSLFPGAGLLDRGFEQAGFVVVRGPDTLFGQDIRDFHFPSSAAVAGVVGGPPCQDFSGLRRRAPSGYGQAMLAEFRRVVTEAQPDWWLMENVPRVPDMHIAGYVTQRFNVFASEFGLAQKRNRSFQFGSDGRKLVLVRGIESQKLKPAVVAKDEVKRRRNFADLCELQGLPRNFNLPGRSLSAKVQLVGNGVPVPVAYAIACAIRDRSSSVTVTLCECDCGRPVTGKQRLATAACRKRMERRRRSMSHRAASHSEQGEFRILRVLEDSAPAKSLDVAL